MPTLPKTVICHFYNEEYLLPWWLRHQSKVFDHGVMIDYGSNDKSCNIIREMCPTWTIVPTRQESFDFAGIEPEIYELEKSLPVEGWRIILNVTEYLVGNYTVLDDLPSDTEFKIGCHSLVELDWGKQYTYDLDIIDQCPTGFTWQKWFDMRFARAIRNYTAPWPYGRHYHSVDTNELVVYHYGFAPWNEQALSRRTQIKDKCSQQVKSMYGDQGMHHLYGDEKLRKFYQDHVDHSFDMREENQKWIQKHIDALGYR